MKQFAKNVDLQVDGEKLYEDDQLFTADMSKISTSPLNPRKNFPNDEIHSLAESIYNEGLIRSLIVRRSPAKGGTFEIVDGERRFRAMKLLKREKVSVIIRPLTDEQALSLMVIDQVQKASLTALEEGKAFLELVGFGDNRDDIASKIGKSLSYVDKRLKLNSLIPEFKEDFNKGFITLGAALCCARESEVNQNVLWKAFKDKGDPAMKIDSDDIRSFAESNLHLALKDAPFNTKSTTLFAQAGNCADCDKRTGSHPELFDDIQKDSCTDAACYKKKVDSHIRSSITKNGKSLQKLSNMTSGKAKDVTYLNDYEICNDQKKPLKTAKKGIIIGGNKNWQGFGKGDIVYFTKKKKSTDMPDQPENITAEEMIEDEIKNKKYYLLALGLMKESLKGPIFKSNIIKNMIESYISNIDLEPCIFDLYNIPWTEESFYEQSDEKLLNQLFAKCKSPEDYFKLSFAMTYMVSFEGLDSTYSRDNALKEFMRLAKELDVDVKAVKAKVNEEVKKLKKTKSDELKKSRKETDSKENG